ncbi:hypothetical protein R6Q59_003130 [Mikania micrantha]
MDSVFDVVCGQERKEKPESFARESAEEEPENVILDDVSKDPYVVFLYAHKYVNPERQENAPLANVIDSWFDRERSLSCEANEWKAGILQAAEGFLINAQIRYQNHNNSMFFNPSKDSHADLFVKFIKDQCDRDFPVMKTTKGRRFVPTCILDLVKKEPWIYYNYPLPHTEKAILVSLRAPDNSLANFMSWYFDEKTLAAVILQNKDHIKDIDMILDPMDLLKFGKENMR